MIHILTCCIILLCVSSSVVYGNTGVFFGAGNQVMPIKNNDIQLVKENVSIKLRIDEQDNAGLGFLPRADVQAEFLLRNTKGEPANIEMGFPFLDLQGFGDEKLVLSKLNFRVTDTERERKVTLKEGIIEPTLDPKGLFKKVFVWEEQFQPQQTKKLIVTYQLLLGVASANSIMRGFQGDEWRYSTIDKLFPAISYNFGYITKTAYTWKGPIENAVFSMDCSDFFERINRADYLKSFPDVFPIGISRPVFLYDIQPSAFTRDKGVFRWEFKGNVPEEGINAAFVVFFIPVHSKDLSVFLSGRESMQSKGALNLPFLEKKAAGEEINRKELLSILQGYYTRILKKEPENEASFLKKYFQPVSFLKGQMLFEEDRQAVSATLESVKTLTN